MKLSNYLTNKSTPQKKSNKKTSQQKSNKKTPQQKSNKKTPQKTSNKKTPQKTSNKLTKKNTIKNTIKNTNTNQKWIEISKTRKMIVNEIEKNKNIKDDLINLYNELNMMEIENKQNDKNYKIKLEEFLIRTGMTHVQWNKCIKIQKKSIKNKKNIKNK